MVDKFCFNVCCWNRRFGEGTIEIVNGVPVAIFFLEMKQLELEVCDYKNLLSMRYWNCVCL